MRRYTTDVVADVGDGRIGIDRTDGSEDVDMPMPPELRAACDAVPKVHLTCIITAHDKARSGSTMTQLNG
jgi:hypothetical protein